MPHKHTRRDQDESVFNLPPTQIAKPLPPTFKSKKKAEETQKKKSGGNADKKADTGDAAPKKRKRGKDTQDDMPRAFKRLMAFTEGKKTRSGLDNGDRPAKGKGKKSKGKGKAAAAEEKEGQTTSTDTKVSTISEELKIRPGERLSEFNQRVDAALPLGGLVNNSAKHGKDPLGLKVWRTKKEMKMHRLYDEWREEDRKIKEKREEEMEEAEQREMENEEMGVTWKLDQEAAAGNKKKGKKKGGGRMKYIGEAGEDEDPWEEIKRKRGEAKVGLNEVAHAPPELKLPGKKLTVRGAGVEVADIPKAAGSLRQREELHGIREEVVANYRKMMSERRPQLGA